MLAIVRLSTVSLPPLTGYKYCQEVDPLASAIPVLKTNPVDGGGAVVGISDGGIAVGIGLFRDSVENVNRAFRRVVVNCDSARIGLRGQHAIIVVGIIYGSRFRVSSREKLREGVVRKPAHTPGASCYPMKAAEEQPVPLTPQGAVAA